MYFMPNNNVSKALTLPLNLSTKLDLVKLLFWSQMATSSVVHPLTSDIVYMHCPHKINLRYKSYKLLLMPRSTYYKELQPTSAKLMLSNHNAIEHANWYCTSKNVEVDAFSYRKTTTVTLRPSIKSEPTVDLCMKKRGDYVTRASVVCSPLVLGCHETPHQLHRPHWPSMYIYISTEERIDLTCVG